VSDNAFYVRSSPDSTQGTDVGVGYYAGARTALPTGIALCDGANYSQALFPKSYAALGDRFSRSTNVHVNGKPWKSSPTASGTITSWTTGTSLPGVLKDSQAVVTKNRVYLLGGSNDSSYLATVYTAPINSDGTLGTWTTGTSLPGNLKQSQAVMTKDRVHLMGGDNGSSVSTVYTAPVNSDGTLGTWTTGTSLPAAKHTASAVVTKDRVYLMGGDNGSGLVSNVYTAPVNSDGTLGSWSTTTSLPGGLRFSQAVVNGNWVYLLGGGTPNAVSTVYRARVYDDGSLGAWSTDTSLPGVLRMSQAVVVKNYVYLLGGSITSTSVSTVYMAQINADGSIGAWTTGTSLPGNLEVSQAIITKDHVYTLGGWNGSNTVSTVYVGAASGAGLNDYLTGTTLSCYLPATGGSEFAVPRLPLINDSGIVHLLYPYVSLK